MSYNLGLVNPLDVGRQAGQSVSLGAITKPAVLTSFDSHLILAPIRIVSDNVANDVVGAWVCCQEIGQALQPTDHHHLGKGVYLLFTVGLGLEDLAHKANLNPRLDPCFRARRPH